MISDKNVNLNYCWHKSWLLFDELNLKEESTWRGAACAIKLDSHHAEGVVLFFVLYFEDWINVQFALL